MRARLWVLVGCLLAVGWARGAAMTDAALAEAVRYSREHGGRAVLVWEAGRMRAEHYHNGGKASDTFKIYSGTKTFFGILALIAQEQGRLDLDEPAHATLGEWAKDARKRKITLRHLLNFTSGLDDGFDTLYERDAKNKLTQSVGLRAVREPGAAFLYGPSHLQVFAEVLRRKLKGEGVSYRAYLEREVLKPLGIRCSAWREDRHGNPFPSAGMEMTARDWMKVGQLLGQEGQWRGRALLPEGALAELATASRINPSYGLTIWVNRAAGPRMREVNVEAELKKKPLPEDWRGTCLARGAPRDLVAAVGSFGQRLYVVPSQDLVILHRGTGKTFEDGAFLGRIFRGADGE